jgi:hypothetical protein
MHVQRALPGHTLARREQQLAHRAVLVMKGSTRVRRVLPPQTAYAPRVKHALQPRLKQSPAHPHQIADAVRAALHRAFLGNSW